MVLAQVALSRAVPDDLRARTIGVAAAGLQTAQGLGVLLAGALAEVMSPAASIAICSAAGSACAMLISVACRPGATRPDVVLASAELPAHAAPQSHDTRANGDS
jgi:predicted MFS family arabinose efflux permease